MKDLRKNYDMDNAKDLGNVFADKSSFELLNERKKEIADSLGINEIERGVCIYDNNRGVSIYFSTQLNAYWTCRLG